jgi:hypothetical protein
MLEIITQKIRLMPGVTANASYALPGRVTGLQQNSSCIEVSAVRTPRLVGDASLNEIDAATSPRRGSESEA